MGFDADQDENRFSSKPVRTLWRLKSALPRGCTCQREWGVRGFMDCFRRLAIVLRLFLTLSVCLMLAGCVLQSGKPNFKEADGVALPKALGTRFILENFSDGAWTSEDGAVSFAAAGKHYVARNEKADEIEVLFAALGKGSWVMQAAEKNKPSAYVMVEAKDDTLLLRPLFCDDLKKQEASAKLVRFEGNDCFLKGHAGVDVFKTLSAKVGDAKMRLRVVKNN
jgi:hypothetical protein